MSLSRDQILKHVTLPVGEVDVPELGGKVRIAGLSVNAAEGVRSIADTGSGDIPFGVRVVIAFACDDKGEPLFTIKDAPALGRLHVSAINAITKVALDLNGLSDKSKEEAKNGSGASGTDGSDSGSPSPSEELSTS